MVGGCWRWFGLLLLLLLQYRKMKVYASIPAHYKAEAEDAAMLGADGMGSINTNQMFRSSEVVESLRGWMDG